MATNLKTSTTLCLYTLVSLFILFLSPSIAAVSFSLDSTCHLTPYPTFCTSTLPPHYLSIHDQLRFFLNQSLSITKTILDLISSYLRDQSNNIPVSTTCALEDCLNFAKLNTDFLSNVLQAIENTVTSNQVYDSQTLLSAILTNQNVFGWFSWGNSIS